MTLQHLRVAIASALLVLCASACGKPLADSTYQGEPLFQLRGRMTGRLGTEALMNPSVGIVWLGVNGFIAGNATGLTPVTATSFPVDFQASIFDKPPPGPRPWFGTTFYEVLSAVPIIRGLRLGVVVGIDDVDKDGRANVAEEGSDLIGPDRFFGAATSRIVAYVDPEYAYIDYQGIRLSPGFHILDPCYSAPKEYLPGELVELTLFAPSRHLAAGALATSECPVVLSPLIRGPLQQTLIGGEVCEAFCNRLNAASCRVTCGSELCLRMLEEAPCLEAKRKRMECLAQHVSLVCKGKNSPEIDDSLCPVDEALCPNRPDVVEDEAVAQSPECQSYCTRRPRGVAPEVCRDDCPTVACVNRTRAQPCLAARKAHLACLAAYTESWTCETLFGEFFVFGLGAPLCKAAAQFHHLCPSVY